MRVSIQFKSENDVIEPSQTLTIAFNVFASSNW